MEAGHPQPGCLGVVAQPGQGQLIGGSQQDQGVGRDLPGSNHLVVGNAEVECGVDGLASLRPRREISTGDDVQPRSLQMSHGAMVANGTGAAMKNPQNSADPA